MNDQEYTYSTTRNDTDSATIELQFRPCPQSNTTHPDEFKLVVALLSRFPNHYGTTTSHANVSTVLLRIIPMHHNLINRCEL